MSSPSSDSIVRLLGQYRIEPKELERIGSLDAGLGPDCSWDCLPVSKSHTQDNSTFHGDGVGFDGSYHSAQFMSSGAHWNPLCTSARNSPESQGMSERTSLVGDANEDRKPGAVIMSQTSCTFEPGQYNSMQLEERLPVCCMVPAFNTIEGSKVCNLNVQNAGLANAEYVALPTTVSHPLRASVLLPGGSNDHGALGRYVGVDRTVTCPVSRGQYRASDMNIVLSNEPDFHNLEKFTSTCVTKVTGAVSGVAHLHNEPNSSELTKRFQPESMEVGSEISKLVADIASGHGEEKWIAKFGKSSPYIGVTKHRKSNRWEAHIWIKDYGRQLYLGGFSTAEEAASAYDLVAIKCKGLKATTNFRSERYSPLMSWLSRVSLPEILSHVRRRSKGFSRGNSMYRGVTQHPNGRWESRIGISGNRHIYLGLYEKQEDAASHYDRALVRMRGWRATTNFPFSEYQSELDEHKRLEEKLMNDAEDIECESDPLLRKVYGLWVKKGGWDPLERLILRIRESEETRNDIKDADDNV